MDKSQNYCGLRAEIRLKRERPSIVLKLVFFFCYATKTGISPKQIHYNTKLLDEFMFTIYRIEHIQVFLYYFKMQLQY